MKLKRNSNDFLATKKQNHQSDQSPKEVNQMTKTNTQEKVETVEVNDFSPIQVAEMAGVRPQMVYNYIKAGTIEAFRNDSDKLRVTREVAEAWVAKYQANKVAREEKRAAKLAEELGETPAEA